jgi:hypothetical protein
MKNKINSAFVNFEIAKLLKEKKFDEPCIAEYFNGEITFYDNPDNERDEATVLTTYTNSYPNHSSRYNVVSAPFIFQVIDWLEEKHNIHLDRIWYNDKITEPRWVYHIDHDYACSSISEAIIEALNLIK